VCVCPQTMEVNSKYGFLAECKGRLGPVEGWKVWRRLNEVFNWLPLAARIDSKILCMHGGGWAAGWRVPGLTPGRLDWIHG
jgi:diadenosine tetraphosphatase ApaH/serine/threonine PP2A family protein phosphatase